MSWSPDGKRLASASYDKTVIVWDAQTGEKVRSLEGHSDWVNKVSWSPDGKRLASASEDKTVIVWDAQTGEKIRSLTGHSAPVESVSWSPDGKRLASGSGDKTMIVWDAQTGEQIRSLKGHSHWIDTVSWSPDGKRLASASRDDTVIVWDAESGAKIHTLEGHSNCVESVSWSPDAKRLASASRDRTVIVWDAQTGEKIRSLEGHSATVESVSWSPDGKHLASGSADKTVIVWDAQTGELLRQSGTFGLDWISFTPQGYYHSSLAAEQFIRWRIPGEKGEWPRLVAASQFRDTFYRPDLFRYLFSEGNVARALARADDERGARTRFTDVAKEAPPVVLVTAPKHLSKVTEAEIRVEATAASVGEQPVSSLQLEVNGQPEGRIQRVQEPKPGQVAAEWLRVPLRPGENTLRIVAKAGGTIGYSDTIRVTRETPEQIKVRLHLLLIGVSKYEHAPEEGGYPELRHAASDARRIRDIFVQQGKGLYDDIPEPVVLLDAEADRDKIQDALQAFSERMGKDDVGVIFFAGHGDRHNDRLYLAAHDTLKDRLLKTGISASQLRDTLAGTKGRKYLFLDACHAGEVLQRDGGDSIHEDIIRELRKESAGLVIATACRGNQKANEDELGGYFTTALVEGLSGKGPSYNGVIRCKHLKVYVEA